jgi:hypothetical protein
MRRTILITLAATTAVAAAAAILSPSPDSGGGTAMNNSSLVFPGLKDKESAATKLIATGPQGQVVLERKDANSPWLIPSKGGYPVQDSIIKPILGALVALKTVEPKTERPKLYSRLDLQDPGKDLPSHEVELRQADGTSLARLIIGRTKSDPAGQGGDGFYIRKPGEARTWLAEPMVTLPASELGWIDTKILDVDSGTIQSVILTAPDGARLTVSRDKKEDSLSVIDVPKDTKLKQDSIAETIGGSFLGLELEDVAAAKSAPAGTPAGSVHFTTFDGLTGDLTLTKRDNAVWTPVTAAGTGDAAAKTAQEINGRTAGWIYKLPEATAGTLQSKLTDITEPAKPDEATPAAQAAPAAKARAPGKK